MYIFLAQLWKFDRRMQTLENKGGRWQFEDRRWRFPSPGKTV